MNTTEFLQLETIKMLETFEEHKTCPPYFSVLNNDGEINSYGTSFNRLLDKDAFDSFMRMICSDPRVVASIFIFEGWTSRIAIEKNKRPSECSDRETNVLLIYNTRDSIQNVHIYRPDQKGKLELIHKSYSSIGRFCNPFKNN